MAHVPLGLDLRISWAPFLQDCFHKPIGHSGSSMVCVTNKEICLVRMVSYMYSCCNLSPCSAILFCSLGCWSKKKTFFPLHLDLLQTRLFLRHNCL